LLLLLLLLLLLRDGPLPRWWRLIGEIELGVLLGLIMQPHPGLSHFQQPRPMCRISSFVGELETFRCPLAVIGPHHALPPTRPRRRNTLPAIRFRG